MSAKQISKGNWVHYDDSQDGKTNRHEIVTVGKTIAHIYCTKGDEIEDKANAELIAAAPKLLKALDDLSFFVFGEIFMNSQNPQLREAHNNAFKLLQELGMRDKS